MTSERHDSHADRVTDASGSLPPHRAGPDVPAPVRATSSQKETTGGRDGRGSPPADDYPASVPAAIPITFGPTRVWHLHSRWWAQKRRLVLIQILIREHRLRPGGPVRGAFGSSSRRHGRTP